MKKPHIRKIKGSPYWSCDGIVGQFPVTAYWAWRVWMVKHNRPIPGGITMRWSA